MTVTSRIIVGDTRAVLPTLPSASVDCIVTSPPYWRIRDYGFPEQLGLEETPELFVEVLVGVFRECRRILKPSGNLWVNMGDTYAGRSGGGYMRADREKNKHTAARLKRTTKVGAGLRDKNLVGVPWMLAFALRADGWILRQDNIWSKPAPVPEAVIDRTTRSHEYVFHLTRNGRYFYNAEAISEPASPNTHPRGVAPKSAAQGTLGCVVKSNGHFAAATAGAVERRNKRSVWTISAGGGYSGEHTAPFPAELAEVCVLAGCPPGGTVLDPFAGTGTVGVVAAGRSMSFIGIEGSMASAEEARQRIGLFSTLELAG